jgi:hypothetical protein
MKAVLASAASAAVLATLVVDCSSMPTYMTREQLLDPQSCQKCHDVHYADWSGSMHAYASDDPVFLAMNARGQRETNGQLGSFCVNCHAPMALREKDTTDGSNLASVPQKLKGVTCYFCHTIDSITDTHNAPVHLAGDVDMRGPITNPVTNTAHPSTHSDLHDRDHLDSARLCGSCHDVVNGHGTAIERTFSEWQSTVFSQPMIGNTCGQCHMDQSTSTQAVAQYPGVPLRRYHDHSLSGVDTALIPFAESDSQKQSVQALLDSSLQSAVCVATSGFGIDVILDNVAAGHGLPSGSSQDRRLWTEVVAYNAGNVIYQSGVVPDDAAVTTPSDPDLWLMRDCMLDDQQTQVPMFWQAYSFESTELPGPQTLAPMDARFYQTHVFRSFPRAPETQTMTPDRVTMRVRLRPIDFDVIDDLIGTGDLDPSVRAAISTLEVGQSVEWTPSAATASYARDGIQYACVSTTNLNFSADKFAAPEAPDCTH